MAYVSRNSGKRSVNIEGDCRPEAGGRGNASAVPARAGGYNFVRLGKEIAPWIGGADDRSLVRAAVDGQSPDDIARELNARAAEVTVRLVQLRTGPLGRVRPAAGGGKTRVFEDVAVKPPARHVPERQPPILSLAAVALGDVLQRLGDRLYVAGTEAPLPEVVMLARRKGVRIRYPLIDPVASAWNGGPSRRETPRTGPVAPWERPR
tara:strand:- start:1554 stop:2174 length:621 start_codon:yes stop_codon:yes gene_type:complete